METSGADLPRRSNGSDQGRNALLVDERSYYQGPGGSFLNLFLVLKQNGQAGHKYEVLNWWVQVATEHLKMEGMSTLCDLLRPGDR